MATLTTTLLFCVLMVSASATFWQNSRRDYTRPSSVYSANQQSSGFGGTASHASLGGYQTSASQTASQYGGGGHRPGYNVPYSGSSSYNTGQQGSNLYGLLGNSVHTRPNYGGNIGGSNYRPSYGGSSHRPSYGGSSTRPSYGGSSHRPSYGGSFHRPSYGGSHTRPFYGGSSHRPTNAGSHIKPYHGQGGTIPSVYIIRPSGYHGRQQRRRNSYYGPSTRPNHVRYA
ncbi:PREDICTED: TATA-binding protein-associated factor 2N-like [Priapulus caudatus]|uniref:TATA-binding protein-associated factor 2N-like n=1 Tax=Priapulus caudatus TaxID=37621 RepID=A0ABM1FA64_PRICU|nr:PREDICTED: TATA-binding protein-associated factor 2N-like [Priapulus caudatus]XP_014681336.1 PREDICTED: TATA-binding protein-associated factor 2N-like [Priapulus caudatus]